MGILWDRPSNLEPWPQRSWFVITSYRDGFYQISGEHSPEPLLSAAAIERWEAANNAYDDKLWGTGPQGLFLPTSR